MKRLKWGLYGELISRLGTWGGTRACICVYVRVYLGGVLMCALEGAPEVLPSNTNTTEGPNPRPQNRADRKGLCTATGNHKGAKISLILCVFIYFKIKLLQLPGPLNTMLLSFSISLAPKPRLSLAISNYFLDLQGVCWEHMVMTWKESHFWGCEALSSHFPFLRFKPGEWARCNYDLSVSKLPHRHCWCSVVCHRSALRMAGEQGDQENVRQEDAGDQLLLTHILAEHLPRQDAQNGYLPM